MSKNNENPSFEARLLSLNLRLSTLEEKHGNLSHRVDESEDEINEIWDFLGKCKPKSLNN